MKFHQSPNRRAGRRVTETNAHTASWARIISAVHSKYVVGSARNKCNENNEASRDKALSLLSYSTHCTFDNSARPLSFPVDAIAVGGEKRVVAATLSARRKLVTLSGTKMQKANEVMSNVTASLLL